MVKAASPAPHDVVAERRVHQCREVASRRKGRQPLIIALLHKDVPTGVARVWGTLSHVY